MATRAADDSAQQLARDAKARRATLKALLDDAAAQPGAAAIDYARRECRHAYLKLLFACTFSSRAQGADAALWSETTHPLVHLFRSRLAAYEKAFKASHARSADAAAPSDPQPPKPAVGGRTAKQAQAQQAQAYLRLATAFRDFLLAEENFWRDLAGRVVRVFRLDEARANLRALDIPCDADADSSFASDTSASTGLDRIPGAGASGALPGAALLQAASLPGNRTRLLEVVHKALLCCGDLARYRELYRDDRGGGEEGRGGAGSKRGGAGAGRGRAGKVIAAAAVARTSKEVSSRRDFSRAAACYEQARLLLPDNGNPSNQLAVIATYSGDPFLSIYHYYRALCVRVPFDTARQNLELTLRKAVAAWSKEGGRERLLAGGAKEKLDETAAAVLRDFVVLHGLFYTREKFAIIQPFAEEFLSRFSRAIVSRTLAADAIVRIVVTGLAASWTARLWRSGAASTTSSRPRPGRGAEATTETSSAGSAASAEHQNLTHVLGIMQRLVKAGTSETREALDAARKSPPTAPARMRGGAGEAAASAARHISAAFRRMLPALRILSKWMKSHLEYMSRSADRAAALSQESSLSQDLGETEVEEAQARALADAALVQTTVELWKSYVSFINTLRFAFPFDALPSLGAMGQTGAAPLALEEDSDMRGFAPTRKAMLYVNGSTPGSSLAQPRASQVHPNEEQLMRIADLLIDAKVMAESDASPIYFDDERNLFALDEQGPGLNATQESLRGGGDAAETQSAEPQSSLDRIGLRDALPQRDDDPEIASESTEDVVDMAMRAGVGELDDSDDDLILIPSASAASRTAAAAVPQPQDPGTPAAARSRALAPASGASTPSPMTAQHLLLQVLTGRSPAQSPSQPHAPALHAPSLASAPAQQPHLLFGGVARTSSDFSGAGQASIWASGPGDVHHSHARAFSPPARAWDTPGGYASPQQQQQRHFNAQQEHASGSPFAAGRATQHLGGAFAAAPGPMSYAGGTSQASHASSMNGAASAPFASYASSSGFAPPGPDAFAAPQGQHTSPFAGNGHAQQRAPHDAAQSFLNG